MSPRHLDRLSPTDVYFLALEEGGAHMHIGGVAVFEGPPPDHDDILRLFSDRLHLVPRYRQKLAYPPRGVGRPWWVDDECFNLEYHVRRTALPAPGTEEQLHRLVGRLASQRLDRDKPLWETWIVEGLSDDRFAMVTKVHHAMVDGVSNADLMVTLLDLEREPRRVNPERWRPQSTPSGAGLLARQAQDLARNSMVTFGRTATIGLSPRRLVGAARDLVQAAGDMGKVLVTPAPPTPLNVVPGPHRRYAIVRERLDDFKTVKAAFGGTVNDVVLTCVGTALGRFLADRGTDTRGLALRACVPLSIRTDDKQSAGGNEIAIMVAPLPVEDMDPVERLRLVSRSMGDLKQSKQALSAQLLAEVNQFAPPNILARAARIGFSPRLYNLLVTNVPGPQFPVYMLGREMLEAFPLAFLAPTHAVAIAVFSYNGQVNLGLLGDYDAVPDLDALGKETDTALTELVTLAGA